ncbi:hypothetical protein BD309DRAFT_866223, partial [Dichomitus squalens]
YHTARIAPRRMFCSSSHLPSSPSVLEMLSNDTSEPDKMTESVVAVRGDENLASGSQECFAGAGCRGR